jgi:hypothetical protein
VVFDGSRRNDQKALRPSEGRIEGFRFVEVTLTNTDTADSQIGGRLGSANAHAELFGRREAQELRDDIRTQSAGGAGYNDFSIVVCHAAS